MLDNSTKDEMYTEICDKLNCSRHAAKVLVHCFIWECSEAYMKHVAFESSHLLGDAKIGVALKEPEMKTVPKVGNVYKLKILLQARLLQKVKCNRFIMMVNICLRYSSMIVVTDTYVGLHF